MNKTFLLDIELDTEYITRINQSQKIGISLGIFALLFPIIFFLLLIQISYGNISFSF